MIDEKPIIFNLEPSDFKSDLEYTRAIIRQVRRTHSIDDRMENARRDSISKVYTTLNIWPTALRAPMVKEEALRDLYYVKAMVPICKETYRQCYNPKNLVTEKVKFKLTKEEYLKDQVIFGVMTAENFVGQMPPVHVCEQNHEGGAIWYDRYQELLKTGKAADDDG